MSLPIKTYLPALAAITYRLCRYITKHRSVLVSVVATISPSDSAAFSAALDAVVAACALFERLHLIYDPNAPATE